jgi:mono/diheme cytochrome c family protein
VESEIETATFPNFMRAKSLMALVFPGLLPAGAQVPLIPSLTPEQTKVALFSDYREGAGGQRLTHPQRLANFRVHLEFRLPGEAARASLRLGEATELPLVAPADGVWRTLELRAEQAEGNPGIYSAEIDGKPVAEDAAIGATVEEGKEGPAAQVRFDRDFTVMVSFRTAGKGALFSFCRREKWEPDAKMLGLRDGRLFFDVGWLGAVTGRSRNLEDGKPHTAVLRMNDGRVQLFVDGRPDAAGDRFRRPDAEGHRLHVGQGSAGFEGDLEKGGVSLLRYWERSLSDDEAKALSRGEAGAVNTPLYEWKGESAEATFPRGIPGVPVRVSLQLGGGAEIRGAWAQPLDVADHAALIRGQNAETLAEGAKIYRTLCVTCHGTDQQEGSMPTSRKFHLEAFRNGSDPWRQYQTLTHGYGLMMPMPQYTAAQKYAVIHYLRETFVRPLNPTQYAEPEEAWLASLPRRMKTLPAEEAPKEDPATQHERMDYGPYLMWTYQTGPATIAQKGIAMRLDEGAGGVSRGRAWMVYEHDTLQAAAATTGAFIDWRGVAFDGSHGTHASLTGEALFVNPDAPAWANPETGNWEDLRFRGRDGKPYGPLPRTWCRFEGLHRHGGTSVLQYTVGDARVLEAAELIEYGTHPLFVRTLNAGKSSRDLRLRLAPEGNGLVVRVVGEGAGLVTEGGFHVLNVPASATPGNFRIGLTRGTDEASVEALVRAARLPLGLEELTKGGPAQWTQTVETEIAPGEESGPFAADVLTHPDAAANPWQSWLRLTGFDFYPDGDRAAVCTWMGDVWTVAGIGQPTGKLRWRRIATGLFQPLGLKIVRGEIYVCCRDQIAKLHDRNADGETDFVECFNSDHQVTEHFHEFAMGLQADASGNFYYAKSGRHALKEVVAHHGTLLKVSADGVRTDILATGFRAANGVCLNPDGTFFVTDQEGFWTPKNRINLVRGKGPGEFYGNMFGYTPVTDSSDAAMEQPLCWVTNAFDRSPSELVWVPQEARWGPFNGALLNLSYGYGRIYTVPHEMVDGQAQGGMCALPLPQFPTGVMRGRFHPRDGQFYACGMFAWAGNQSQPGGFYRVRWTGKAALQPIGLRFRKDAVEIDLSDAPDSATVGDAGRYEVKAWDLKRSANYGSEHVGEHGLAVAAAALRGERTVVLTVPGLHPAMGVSVRCRFRGADGTEQERVIHGTVHRIPDR